MSKKYMSRPYCYGPIPEYTTPPMTVEEYRYYEKEFFGFLDEKPTEKQEEAQSGFVQNFLLLIGISKISEYEDEVPAFKLNVHHVLRNNEDSQLGGMGDNLNDGASATVTNRVVRKETKATQTEDVTTSDQEVQTEKKSKKGFLKACRRFLRRSCKCLKTGEE